MTRSIVTYSQKHGQSPRRTKKIKISIYGPHYDLVTEQFRIRKNIKVKKFFTDPEIVQEIKLQRLQFDLLGWTRPETA